MGLWVREPAPGPRMNLRGQVRGESGQRWESGGRQRYVWRDSSPLPQGRSLEQRACCQLHVDQLLISN